MIGLAAELEAQGVLKDHVKGMRVLIEENVRRQVDAVAKSDVMLNAWAAGKRSAFSPFDVSSCYG